MRGMRRGGERGSTRGAGGGGGGGAGGGGRRGGGGRARAPEADQTTDPVEAPVASRGDNLGNLARARFGGGREVAGNGLGGNSGAVGNKATARVKR